MRKLLAPAALLSFALAASPATLSAQQAPLPAADNTPAKAILILPFHVGADTDGYDALAEGLRDLLTADLSSFSEIHVVERDHLDQILKEHELSLSGLAKDEDRLALGRLVTADLLLSGTFTLIDSKITINARLVDIPTSQLIRSRKVVGSIDEWLDAERDLARHLAQDLNLEITEVQERAIDTKPEVSLHFIKGLGRYYGCNYDHAIMEFMNTLYGDEKYVEARFWMARSYLALDEPEHARIEFERILRDFPEHPLAHDAARSLASEPLNLPAPDDN